MKHSIRHRYTLILVGILLAVVIGIFLCNNFLLVSYVASEKQKKVLETVNLIEDLIDSEFDSDQELALIRMCSTNNIGLGIYDVSGFVPSLRFSTNYDGDSFNARFQSYVQGEGFMADKVLEQTDQYVLYQVYDTRLGSVQIECIGKTGSIRYIISTSMNGVKESVSVTNQFLVYVGLVGILVGGILVYFVSWRLTRPIQQLASLSEELAELNFEASYTGKEKNEIGILGGNMNRMSGRLQMTIHQLKEANLQLEADIREKEHIDELRREFISNVSHELKTPIALIQGYSEGLKDGIGDDDRETREFYCDVIIDEAKKMNHMVKRLLNLDEMESGQMEPCLEQFDLVQAIRGVMQALAMLSKGKVCQVSLQAEETIPVLADEFMIEEVVQNYLSNAYNHVSDPGEIQISAERLEGGTVHVSVRNTGNIIPEEDLDQIWDKFYKVDKARTRKYGGSGIGLSIVKAIMNTHGGSCGVRNCEDGVEFWFELNVGIE